jgi:hypothetical protein
MSAFDSSAIHQLTVNLAQNLLQVWANRRHAVPPAYATAEQLAALLEPGITAYVGRLMVLAPEQVAAMPEVMARFFANLATAEAFDHMLFNTADTTHQLVELLQDAGLEINWPVDEYLGEALAMFVSAVSLTNRIEIEGEEADEDTPLTSLPPLFHFSPDITEQMKELVLAIHNQGLDRIELGQVIGADGDTVLFSWPPLAMAEPPPVLPEAIGPEETLGEVSSGSGSDPSGRETQPDREPATANGGSKPSIQPPAPSQSSKPEIVDLRLDAALPERVTVGRAFDLAVAIKQLASPPLAPDDLARRESTPFSAVWTGDAPFIQLRVQVSAPDCTIHNGDTRPVRLIAGQDGPPVYFQLTPNRAGPLSVIITVYQEMDWVGSTRLRTEAGEGDLRGAMTLTVNSRPLDSPELNPQTLWKALVEGFNESELQDLCFELNVDYEELPGDTKSAKARELVKYATRHDTLNALIERVMASRPHLLRPFDD